MLGLTTEVGGIARSSHGLTAVVVANASSSLVTTVREPVVQTGAAPSLGRQSDEPRNKL
jgi:hypothetical protein